MAPVPGLHLHPPWHPPASAPAPGQFCIFDDDTGNDDDADRDVCYATYPVQMVGSGQVKEQILAHQ